MHKNTPSPDLLQVWQRFDAARSLQAEQIDALERRVAALTATPRSGAIVVDTADTLSTEERTR